MIVFDGLTLEHGLDAIGTRMGRFDVCATCVVCGPRVADAAASILSAVSQLPVRMHADTIESASPIAGGGVVVRIAGTSVEQVAALLRGRLDFLPVHLGDDPWTRKW